MAAVDIPASAPATTEGGPPGDGAAGGPGVGAPAGEPGKPTAFVADRRTLVAFGSMLVAIFLAALDSTLVATALPAIGADLGRGAATWVISSFLLATAVTIPLWGKVSDLVGRRRPYLVATGLFLVSSLLAGLTPSMAGLVLARTIQGVGTGGLMALSPAIVGELFPAHVRGRYQGFYGAALGAAGIAGPLVGGTFVDTVGWRWAFLANVPLGGLALLGVWRSLHIDEHRRRAPLDVAGAVTLSVASLAFLLALGDRTPFARWPLNAVTLAVGLAAAVTFVRAERRAVEPLLPLRLLRNPIVRNALLLTAACGAALVAVTINVPLYVQAVEGSTATASGIVVVPLTVGMLVASIGGGNLIVRLGRYRPLPIAGTIAMTLGLGLLSTIGPHTPAALLVVAMAVVGAGVGLVMQPSVLAIQNAVARDDLGTATAAWSFLRQMASTAAVGILGGLLSRWGGDALSALDAAGPGGDPAARAVAAGAIGDLFLVLVPVALAAVVVAVTLQERPLE